MAAYLTTVAIIGLFLVLAAIIARVDGLAFMAPKSTRTIQASAQSFCTDRCRTDGLCPLTGTAERAGDCPLWKYVAADVPTMLYGSPFEATRVI